MLIIDVSIGFNETTITVAAVMFSLDGQRTVSRDDIVIVQLDSRVRVDYRGGPSTGAGR